MKKLLFSAMALAVFQLANAQSFTTFNGTDRFIEVKVSDTMKVAADIIKVKIKLPDFNDLVRIIADDEYYNEPYEYKEEIIVDKKRTKKSLALPPPPEKPSITFKENYSAEELYVNNKDSISAYLNSKKIAFVFHEPSDTDVNPFSKEFEKKDNSFELVLSSPEQYEEIRAEISKFEGVKVSVTGAETSQKYEYELALIDKLMKKANNEAVVIAKAMGAQLDKPLNVTNISFDNMYSSMFNDPNSMGGMGALFSMMGNLFKSQDEATSVVINKSIVVRFGIK